jgi:hypothetical protein
VADGDIAFDVDPVLERASDVAAAGETIAMEPSFSSARPTTDGRVSPRAAGHALVPRIRRARLATVQNSARLWLVGAGGLVVRRGCGPAARCRARETGSCRAAAAERIARGGYVLYFRHTATDFGQNDEKMTGFEDCANQRNLTDGGRADARAIGAAIRSLDIPIGAVSPAHFVGPAKPRS